MVETQKTPVLIIGFNRPETLRKQLLRIEELAARTVWVSIDGPRNLDDKLLTNSCLKEVSKWSRVSKHNVTLRFQEENLGIYKHSMSILQDFFEQHEVGLVLEDDIEFRSEFVTFVDQISDELTLGKYWSICGHNPVSDLTEFSQNDSIFFGPSHVHTIWGWAAHRNSIKKFVTVASQFSSGQFELAINKGAQSISKDPVYRLGFRKVWTRKVRRANARDSHGGWDNFWVAAAWDSGLPSLLPEFSLSRENPYQDEGQTHAHATFPTTWEKVDWNLGKSFEIRGRLTTSDVRISKVWGISRLYCWMFFFRILRS